MPAPGDHESDFKKVSAIRCKFNNMRTQYLSSFENFRFKFQKNKWKKYSEKNLKFNGVVVYF